MVKITGNRWKWAFFVLLGAVLLLVVVQLSVLLLWLNHLQTSPDGLEEWPPGGGSQHLGSGTVFTLSASKQDLNTLISAYVAQDIDQREAYELYVDDEIYFKTEIPIFNRQLPLVMSFEAQVLSSGNLLLKQHTMRLGGLQLPADLVLAVIKGSYHFPEWVTINPGQAEIHLALNQLKIHEQFYLKALKFDLKQDEIIFQLIYEEPVSEH
ncbi:uncharacterized protein YpmS [Caldalkalibacillus uzonensis]|uniref:Uncharacterized protein YpmS n=1 Tax=Caldalkalibacillus uzonensis TaxID=353224 RepID=A0ABU0CRZ4_9BACI|nr:YpmS family protein [Caldalkalibacillus uzonensis]MDQ0339190.1 uncharacterized protein YpmS [Caldalkalibacillus uzonensis]